jgi:hypothetical protein
VYLEAHCAFLIYITLLTKKKKKKVRLYLIVNDWGTQFFAIILPKSLCESGWIGSFFFYLFIIRQCSFVLIKRQEFPSISSSSSSLFIYLFLMGSCLFRIWMKYVLRRND